jgi:hypothetical protein
MKKPSKVIRIKQSEKLENSIPGGNITMLLPVKRLGKQMLRLTTYIIIMISLLVPYLLKTIISLGNNDMILAATSVVACLFLVVAGYFTWKGNTIFKWLICGFCALSGLLMLPWYYFPNFEFDLLRLALGTLGIFWLSSSIWIFKKAPKKKPPEGIARIGS